MEDIMFSNLFSNMFLKNQGPANVKDSNISDDLQRNGKLSITNSTLNNARVNGKLVMEKSQAKKTIKVNGNLSATNSKINNVNVNGKLLLNNSHVQNVLSIAGELHGEKITANNGITAYGSSKISLKDSNVTGNISVSNSTINNPSAKPKIILDGTVIKGDVNFDHDRKGYLILQNSARVEGKVHNAADNNEMNNEAVDDSQNGCNIQ